jgi:hypothetical protein
VILLGDDGVGKSTIAGRVATAAALEGASVARLQCHELERELPFGVAGALVEQLIELPGAAATPPEQLAELARLVAKVRQRWPALPAPSNAVGEAARIQFTEAVMGLVAALAAEQPVVIVCDDLHLADMASLAVLHLMLRRIDAEPVMALVTMTGVPGELRPEVGRFALRPEAIRATVLEVGPLPEAHAAELVEELVAGLPDPGPTVRRALLAGARGNPMVLELLASDWRRRGEESLALATGAMTRPAQAPAAACQSLVAAMLGSLDQETRAVADLGAVLGRRLNELGMYALMNLPVSRTMRALTALTTSRILRDAGTHLEFTNAVVRGECYQAMAAPIRRIMHSMVADRLISGPDEGEPISGLEVAWHLVRAERLDEAVPYLLSGGREAIRRGAPHEADLALSTGLPVLSGAARRTGILLLAEALQELGRWGDSLRVLQLPEHGYDEEENAQLKILGLLNKRWIGMTLAELQEGCTSLLTIASSQLSIHIRCAAASAAVALLSSLRDHRMMSQLADISRALIAACSDDYDKIHLLHAHAWSTAHSISTHASLPLLDEGVALIDRSGTACSIAVRLILGAGVTRCQVGDYAGSVPFIERAYSLSLRLDNPLLQSNAAAGLALALGRLGHRTSQIDWARRALSVAQHSEWGICVLSAAYDLGLGLALDGRPTEAVALVQDMGGRFGRNKPRWVQQAWGLISADILAVAGQHRKARRVALATIRAFSTSDLHECFVGLYARWKALTSTGHEEIMSTGEELRHLRLELGRYDAKDQAEILAAHVATQLKLGREREMEPEIRDLRGRLQGLPSVVAVLLDRTRLADEAGDPQLWSRAG